MEIIRVKYPNSLHKLHKEAASSFRWFLSLYTDKSENTIFSCSEDKSPNDCCQATSFSTGHGGWPANPSSGHRCLSSPWRKYPGGCQHLCWSKCQSLWWNKRGNKQRKSKFNKQVFLLDKFCHYRQWKCLGMRCWPTQACASTTQTGRKRLNNKVNFQNLFHLRLTKSATHLQDICTNIGQSKWPRTGWNLLFQKGKETLPGPSPPSHHIQSPPWGECFPLSVYNQNLSSI